MGKGLLERFFCAVFMSGFVRYNLLILHHPPNIVPEPSSRAPPGSPLRKKNDLRNSDFLDEWSHCLLLSTINCLSVISECDHHNIQITFFFANFAHSMILWSHSDMAVSCLRGLNETRNSEFHTLPQKQRNKQPISYQVRMRMGETIMTITEKITRTYAIPKEALKPDSLKKVRHEVRNIRLCTINFWGLINKAKVKCLKWGSLQHFPQF